MVQRSWSVQDAKNRFSEVVEAARRTPQTVTKHGKPAVIVVDVVEYERLRRLERARAPSSESSQLREAETDQRHHKRPSFQSYSETRCQSRSSNVRMRDLEV